VVEGDVVFRNNVVRRAVTAVLAGVSLVAVAVPVASASTVGTQDYSPYCRAEVADARAWLTSMGRNPGTNDPKVVYRALESVLPLIGGQTHQMVLALMQRIQNTCYI
jgi:hypothetical protein